ncbi:MAG: hypothetical protein K2P81_15435 [Bacteriovoracaceae bacterium]|nr:hypothetical protein [Bacteriovoracaceae bacterium]
MNFPSQVFQLLIAPPAWGKTRLFRQWCENEAERFLYISPLRALAEEVKSLNSKIWVVLPEEILNLNWEEMARAKPNLVVIWDEIHLVPEWGLTFRHAMMESWYGFCLSGLAGVGLTATYNKSTCDFLIESLNQNYSHLLIGDAGNFKFKNPPAKWCVGKKRNIEKLIEEKLSGRTLIFCESRNEVDQWHRKLSHQFRVWPCKGGETKIFREKLKHESPPDIIVATSCLSHGINLPQLERVILLSESFPDWLNHQMRTRAGRRGESYEIWCTWNSCDQNLYLRLFSWLRLLKRVKMLELRQAFSAWWYGP